MGCKIYLTSVKGAVDMMIWGALLILLGLVAVVVLACVLTIHYQKKHPDKRYDERQELSRGKAYGFGLAVGVIYYLIICICCISAGDIQMPTMMLSPILLTGILLALMAVNLYCLMTGALLPIFYNSNFTIFISYALSVMRLIMIIIATCRYETGMDVDLVSVYFDSLMVVLFATTGTFYLLAKLRDKRASDEH